MNGGHPARAAASGWHVKPENPRNMRSTPKIVIVMTVLCAGAYGLHLMQPPSHPASSGATIVAPRLVVADGASAARPASAVDATQTGSALIYPDALAATALHLGYEVFTRNADGSMMALPLPPGSAWRTMLALKAAGHRRLVLAPSHPECAFAIRVDIHRADRSEPVWQAELPAHSSPAKQVVDLAKLGDADPLLVSLAMTDGAQNNWSCNVTLAWDDEP
jgi:hypothetical protein